MDSPSENSTPSPTSHLSTTSEQERVRQERLSYVSMITLSFAVALFFQSGGFQISEWMLGDLAYHRGVAYTMQGGDVQGVGPYAGLLSYFGGLYPLALGGTAAFFDISFDRAISIISWIAPLALPAALWLLGHRLWPVNRTAKGLFVLLATTAAPFSADKGMIWVSSVLPSGHNYWPLYPRDVALVLLVLIASASLNQRWQVRVLGSGFLLGLCIMTQAQIALFAVVVYLVGVFACRRERGKLSQAVGQVGIAGFVALLTSGWWWWPRLFAALNSDLLLASYPGAALLEMDIPTYIQSYGVAGLLGAVGVVMALRKRDFDLPVRLAVFWIASFLPFLLFARIVGDAGVFTERRLWLLLSIPLLILATHASVALLHKLSRVGSVAFFALVVVLAPLPASLQTRELVANAWVQGVWAGQEFALSELTPVWKTLNEHVRTQGGTTVLTYDSLALATWSYSGATVVSLWLPGPVKLGFDPEQQTGFGYIERVTSLNAAFSGGVKGLCDGADRFSADFLLLEELDGLTALYDIAPATLFRVEPTKRDLASLTRWPETGIQYRDINGRDLLRLARGASFTLPAWKGPDIQSLVIYAHVNKRRGGPFIAVTVGDDRTEFGTGKTNGMKVLTIDVQGIDGPITIEAIDPLELKRLSGLVSTGFETGSDGPHLLSVTDVCS